MAFFLIVPSVIIVTIFLVHSAAERLGFKAKYSSLILCAVMALLVNFAAIEMSTYLDKWYYVKLGSLVLVASIIVTLVNRYLVRHEKSDIVIIDDIDDELALEEIEAGTVESTDVLKANSPNEEAITTPKEIESKSTADSDQNIEVKVTVPPKFLQADSDIDESTKFVGSKSTDTKAPVKSVEARSDTKISITTNVQSDTKPVNIAEVEKVSAKSVEVQNTDTKSTVATTIDTKKTEVKSSPESPAKPVDEKGLKSLEDTKIKSTSVGKIEDTQQSKSQDEQSDEARNKLLDIKAHLGSLDDILDYAYAQKTNGDLAQAILAYQKALDRYRSDDYAPFIAIDLGNIYKEQAAYSKVIKTYEEALKLPVVMRNADTRKEFNKNLTYMRIVQSVLIRHRALTMPFSKIPKQYLQEVETEFKSLQFNHSTVQKRY